jgi:REP element-mobilizing transposase RayT
MARALRITFPGAFYHVTSRGNDRKAVFKSKRDREKFLKYLESASQRYDALIHAYCMMDNHVLCRALHKKCYVKPRIM